MKQMNRFFKYCFVYGMAHLIPEMGYAAPAAPADNAQQALQQLRMLQQKLSQNSGAGSYIS